MSDIERQTSIELAELAKQVAASDKAALRFCVSLSAISRTWDHIADGDPIDKDLANEAFLNLILEWPINPFVRAHAASLVPVMAAAISAWRNSEMPGCRIKAYDAISEVWSTVAFILGGWQRVNMVMPAVRAALVAQCQDNDER